MVRAIAGAGGCVSVHSRNEDCPPRSHEDRGLCRENGSEKSKRSGMHAMLRPLHEPSIGKSESLGSSLRRNALNPPIGCEVASRLTFRLRACHVSCRHCRRPAAHQQPTFLPSCDLRPPLILRLQATTTTATASNHRHHNPPVFILPFLFSQHQSASIAFYRNQTVLTLTLPSDLRPPGLSLSKWALSLPSPASSSHPLRHYGQSEHHAVEQRLVPCCVVHAACLNSDPPSLPELRML